jgi:antagonist of KipI
MSDAWRRSRSPNPPVSFVHIVKPGLQTTIQDEGRWGLQSHGVPVAGPMDPCSYRVANALVRNDRNQAALEIALIGPELEFEDERLVAVAGAAFAMSLDGVEVPPNAAFVASAGSRLRFGARVRGSRAYLAIAGGVAVIPVMGSRATHLISRLGGLEGRALTAGDRLPLGDLTRAQTGRRKPRHASGAHLIGLTGPHAHVRLLPGPQREYFSNDALDLLQSAPYSIGRESDRMGFRLEGPFLRHVCGADIISDATPLGVLQVPASGQPVLLMADRQTTGGYPKVATVITADIGVAGQLGPGDTISFSICTPRDAFAALIAQERALMALEAAAAS